MQLLQFEREIKTRSNYCQLANCATGVIVCSRALVAFQTSCNAVLLLFSFQPCVSLESALTEALEKFSASEVLKRVEVNAR